MKIARSTDKPPLTRFDFFVRFVRYGLPIMIAVAGVAVLTTGGIDGLDGFLELITAAVCTFMINWFYRFSADEDEREAEDAAREYLSKHGHWPDED